MLFFFSALKEVGCSENKLGLPDYFWLNNARLYNINVIVYNWHIPLFTPLVDLAHMFIRSLWF